ncbi:sugar ABC transporter substrate-binding protein [Paraburkholderia terricola]|uniref:Monosaccharide ABC transporter substrate-binding protein, CUT2 family n=1 Tax=Paraburkholderia terricola TaxID=169427 RepID=A0A1M6T4S5_9BURK|nr:MULTISPECIES: sugar ABC transporter substrate-binding protein [Paraburkholderia]SDO70103.1 monosaccharide ABC transporter substrate-binding protein, CUT2 family [Paraburkholderia sediminicola]SHK51896.1 monosaccharide ABC transporter substrate-binding protein, CUT2 family [Paraburkholderia terricola]
MNKQFRRLGLIGLASATAFLAGAATAKDVTLGYVAAGMQYPFNVAAARGFEAAAKAAGVKTIMLDAKTSVERQGNAVDDLIAQKVDGIAVLPIDAVVAQSWVDRATSHNIPFVAVATQIGDPQKHAINDVYPKLTALVASDEVHVGFDAAQIAARLLPKGRTAKIAIVEGAPGYPTVWQTTKGFKEGLDKAGVKYQIVASQPTDWTPEKGESVCQNILVAHPDVDLIFNQADDMVIGCARAVRAAGSHAKLVSRGGSKLGINAVKMGDVDGTVCIQPGKMGERAFKALYAAVTGPDTQKARFIDVDTPEVTKATLSSCVPEW